jgi:myo-inositol-1(or 4)-monophosphatase
MLDQVISIAREAGATLLDGFRRPRVLDFKSRAELVTDMDVASERLIIQRLGSDFPDHSILAEESADGKTRSGDENGMWVIDPLDGTNNYAHGVPFWSVSIAFVRGDQPLLGVVYDPIHDECFTATHDGPALLNGSPIRVSPIDELEHAQLCTGFPYDRWTRPDSNVAETAALVMRCQDIRRMGSAALDLCYVAAGRHEAHWEVELKPWDSAAGALVVQRAGGRVTTMRGAPYTPWSGGAVGSNGLIHGALLEALNGARGEAV